MQEGNKSVQQQSQRTIINAHQCNEVPKTQANIFNMEVYNMVEMKLSIRDNMRKYRKMIYCLSDRFWKYWVLIENIK